MALKDNTPRGSSVEKTRNWELIVYPESCPNVKEIVDELGKECEYLLSPIHDNDVTKDGEPKKPHYHLYLFYGGNKSFKQMQELSERFNSKVPPEKVGDKKKAIRYSCHLDNPKKAQYSVDDVTTNIDNISTYWKSKAEAKAEKQSLICRVIRYAKDINAEGLSDLIDSLVDNEDYELLEYVEQHTYLVKTYIEQKVIRNRCKYRNSIAAGELLADSIRQGADQVIKNAVYEYLDTGANAETLLESAHVNLQLWKRGKINA